jgi:hypothetical protein
MRRRVKRHLCVLLLLACASASFAEERFLIERIDVRKLVHASADVIRAESRLQAGDAYAEADLRAASDRVRRLPFVLDAVFSLERGSVRDAYVLVITVSETRPLFFRYQLVPLFESQHASADNDALVGARWFAGSRGVFHVAAIAHESDRPFESSYVSGQAGYTRYGLFDDRAFATLTLDHFSPRETHGRGGTVPGGLMGIWLTDNQTLTLSYHGVDSGSNRRTERIFESRLAYNTTNHPEFPSEGSLVSIAPVFAWIDYLDPTKAAVHDFDVALEGHAARYWTVAEGYTAAAILDGGLLHIEEKGALHRKLTPGYGTVALQLSRVIGDDRADERRLELTLQGVSRHRQFVPLLSSTQASITWVRRNAWGTLRLGVGYAW